MLCGLRKVNHKQLKIKQNYLGNKNSKHRNEKIQESITNTTNSVRFCGDNASHPLPWRLASEKQGGNGVRGATHSDPESISCE